MIRSIVAIFAACLIFVAIVPCVRADDMQTVTLTLKNHKFTPDHFDIMADRRFRITLVNNGDTTGEFESSDLKFEKIVVPGGRASVYAGPLHPGTYKFSDDYHPEAAGTVTAVAKP